MADKEYSPADTRKQATRIRTAWSNIGREQQYGGIDYDDLDASIGELDVITARIIELEDHLNAARNQYRTTRHGLWETVKRARNGVKAHHGDDSIEYERFGGTRMSDRTHSRPKAPAEE